MAIIRHPILGAFTLPDASGDVFFEPSSIKLTNDLYPALALVFKDTATKISVYGRFHVPQNYVSAPAMKVEWFAANTTASVAVVWDFDYRAIAIGEDGDPSTHQESLTVTETAPTTAWLTVLSSLAMTAGNLAAGDTVDFILSRDGVDANDDMLFAALVRGLYFQYSDV